MPFIETKLAHSLCVVSRNVLEQYGMCLASYQTYLLVS
jgi:hypothetical protein